MHKKTLLWITTALDNGAVCKIFFLLAPYFQKIYNITFIVMEHPKDTSLQEKLNNMGISFVSLMSTKLQVFKAGKQLAQHIQAVSPDIVHAHLGRAYIITKIAHQNLKKSKKKIVFLATFHNLFSYFSFLTRIALKHSMRYFHSISAVSDYCLQSYKKILSQKDCSSIVPAVIHNPVEYKEMTDVKNPYDFHDATTKNDNKKLTNAIKNPIILCVARLYAGKGHIDALRMMCKLRLTYPYAYLYFIGEGPLRKKLEKKAIRYGLKNNVVFLGHMDAESVYAHMKFANVIIVPSVSEGFGLVSCEGILQETPVLVENMPLVKELFHRKEWGIFLKSTEKFTELKKKERIKVFTRRVCDVLECEEIYKKFVLQEKESVITRFATETIADKYLKWFSNCEQECKKLI